MLWVVENLQEELFRAQEYRLQAEKRQQQYRTIIASLQVRIQHVFLCLLLYSSERTDNICQGLTRSAYDWQHSAKVVSPLILLVILRAASAGCYQLKVSNADAPWRHV